jgi:hypothetical protein
MIGIAFLLFVSIAYAGVLNYYGKLLEMLMFNLLYLLLIILICPRAGKD